MPSPPSRENRPWPWWAQFAALVLVLAIASFLIVLPILTVKVLGSQYAFSSETDLWASMVAILLGLTTMTVTGVFVFMTFRIDRGARLEAQRTAKEAVTEAAEKAIKEAAEKAIKKEGAVVVDVLDALKKQFEESRQKIDGLFSGINGEVSGILEKLSGLNTDVSAIDKDVSKLNTDVSAIDKDVSKLNKDVSKLNKDVPTIEGKVSDINEEVSNIKGKVSDIGNNVSTLATQVKEGRERIDGKFKESMEEFEELLKNAKGPIASDKEPPDGGDGKTSDGGEAEGPSNDK